MFFNVVAMLFCLKNNDAFKNTPLLYNVSPSLTEGVANRRFYICFVNSRERCSSHWRNSPHIWGVGPHPCWFVIVFFMKSMWFCKTFAATKLHMQNQCTRGRQGIEKSAFTIDLDSAGSCTLKLESRLAWFQLRTPVLPGTKSNENCSIQRNQGTKAMGSIWRRHAIMLWRWYHEKPIFL